LILAVFDMRPGLLRSRVLSRPVTTKCWWRATAGARLGQRIPRDDVREGMTTEIEPGAGKAERRPVAFLEPEDRPVEVACLVDLLGQDREVVHAPHIHHSALPS
jgi:hypothetical protein